MKPDYDRAARMAYKTLLSLNIDEFPIDPLPIIRQCKNTSVHTYSQMAEMLGCSFGYFRSGIAADRDAFVVSKIIGGKVCHELCYDDKAFPLRKRFTLAHELGHIIMKHQGRGCHEELEADFYASQLLVPLPILSVFLPFELWNADDISREFSVSKIAAEKALKCKAVTVPIELSNGIVDMFIHKKHPDWTNLSGKMITLTVQ